MNLLLLNIFIKILSFFFSRRERIWNTIIRLTFDEDWKWALKTRHPEIHIKYIYISTPICVKQNKKLEKWVSRGSKVAWNDTNPFLNRIVTWMPIKILNKCQNHRKKIPSQLHYSFKLLVNILLYNKHRYISNHSHENWPNRNTKSQNPSITHIIPYRTKDKIFDTFPKAVIPSFEELLFKNHRKNTNNRTI